MRWGEVMEAIAALPEMRPEPARISREEFEARCPRVMWLRGPAYHFMGWEVGALWGRIPYEEAVEGESVYRRGLVLEVNWRPLKRALAGFLRVRKGGL